MSEVIDKYLKRLFVWLYRRFHQDVDLILSVHEEGLEAQRVLQVILAVNNEEIEWWQFPIRANGMLWQDFEVLDAASAEKRKIVIVKQS